MKKIGSQLESLYILIIDKKRNEIYEVHILHKN